MGGSAITDALYDLVKDSRSTVLIEEVLRWTISQKDVMSDMTHAPMTECLVRLQAEFEENKTISGLVTQVIELLSHFVSK